MKKLIQILVALTTVCAIVIVGVSIGNKNKSGFEVDVTVNGPTVSVRTDENIKLHTTPYSFDGGTTWQENNSVTVSETQTWEPGAIVVRDATGSVAANKTAVTARAIVDISNTGNTEVDERTDTVLPEMDIVVNGATITVNATDNVALHELAYSFNGGSTWQNKNTYTVQKTYTWPIGSICVKDAAGNISTNGAPVTATASSEPTASEGASSTVTPPTSNAETPPAEKDEQAPVITIKVNGTTITVEATDNKALHSKAYSFDGGANWQAGNTFTATETRTWATSEIRVRDAAGNWAGNTQAVTVTVGGTPVDANPPTMSVRVSEKTVIVEAADDVALHTQAYSFDNGATWQVGNTYTVTETTTWAVGTIRVRDAAENETGSISIVTITVTPPVTEDETPPVISSITASGATVTVVATDDVALHAQAYSFDSGTTWQASNTYTATTTYTWAAGAIKVRDAKGNTAQSTAEVTATVVLNDIVPPTFHIAVSGATIAITNASDDVALHAVPYSFDGGTTWQTENSITVTQTTTWEAGEIVVRDAAENETSNSQRVTATLLDEEAPTFTVEVEGAKVTVIAQDNVGLHTIAYSFDGGEHWQPFNTTTVTETTTFSAEKIQVRDMAGNIAKSTEAYTATPPDVSAPVIAEITVDEATVTVMATDETALHEEAYSFDGGRTWQAENTYTVTEATTWQVGDILVRDAEGNRARNETVMTASPTPPPPEDDTPPVIEAITVSGGTITITATDDVALHAEPYSFDGGEHWQAENTLTVTQTTSWVAGDIVVRDEAENSVATTRTYTADLDTPTFTVEIEDATITITAEDNVALHATAYSFNGGLLWQEANTFTVTESQTWPAGSICVRDAAGNISYNTEVVAIIIETGEPEDTEHPVITDISVTGGTVTVTATDDVALHAEAYSFDGGNTWQVSNAYVATANRTFAIDEIQVRDATEKITKNTTEIVVTIPETSEPESSEPAPSTPESSEPISSEPESSKPEETDNTPPTVEFTVEGATVTITASDEGGLHQDAYCFHGGTNWQNSNTFTVTEERTWEAGEICVRDAAGNITKNTQAITATPEATDPDDDTPPVITIHVQTGQVIIVATDDVALHVEPYSFDNGTTWSANAAYPITEDKTWAVGEIWVRDAANNIAKNTEPVVATIPDNEAPTMTITVEEETVTINAADNIALHEEAYSFDGGEHWQAENYITVTEDTVWQINEIWVRDAAENVTKNTERVSVTMKDTVPPQVIIVTENATITVFATDNRGLHATPYSFDGGENWQATNAKTVTETYTYAAEQIQVKDAAGNITKSTQAYTVTPPDNTPPEVNYVIENGKLTLEATDNVELASLPYSFDGGETWQTDTVYVVGMTETKTWAVGTIWVKDAAGNITKNGAELSITLLDTIPPHISQIEIFEDKLIVHATDNVMLHQDAYSFDNGATWQSSNTYQATEETTFAIGAIQVRDTAGNIAKSKEAVTVYPGYDFTLPEMQVGISSNNYRIAKTITLTATDNEALHAQAYSFDGGTTWQAENTLTVSQMTTFAEGQLRVRDAAGNENFNRTPVVVDKIIKITRNSNTMKTVTIEVTDNGYGLPPAQYSFDGGATWQNSNTYVVTSIKTWYAGKIIVKDAEGNVTKNDETVQVDVVTHGIDVSAHQGYIDWAAVKASGVEYAIIRAVTWSGGTSGYWIVDPFFIQNVKAAKANGIKVGAYIYTYAFNDTEVTQELAVFNTAMDSLKAQGYTLDLPVFVDHEYDKLLTGIPSNSERTRLLKLEMDLLFQNGYYAGMYTYYNWANSYVDIAGLQNQGYDLWLARYNSYHGWSREVPIWQYTSQGSVPGINTNVDMNYLYKDYSTVINGSNNIGAPAGDREYTVYDQRTGTTVTKPRLEIIAAIVNNEVGNTNLTGIDKVALYRAQAVAANSWLLYHYENQNTLPSVALKWDGNYETVKGYITDVINYKVTYNGAVANTVYTSTGNGYTNSSLSYWGRDVAYLRSVWSPDGYGYGATYQGITMVRNAETVKQELIALMGGDYSGSIAVDQWIQITSVDAYGYVTGIKVWGRDVSVSAFYEKVIGPYSPAFSYTYANGQFTFTASGFGHGVGMSQYGAMGLIAQHAYSWQQVLTHYYQGTDVVLST